MLRFPPKKILVPFDLSELSMSAWKQAQVLARPFDAALEVVYIEKPLPVTEVSRFPRDRTHLKRQTLQHICSKLGDDVVISYLEGDPASVILALARTRRSDLIVMGTHGRAGVARALLGSVTESVVRLSTVPVLTVRGKTRPIRSILAPVNFTNYAEHGLAYAAGVAASLKAPLTVLHVGASQGGIGPKPRLKEMLARLPEKVRNCCAPALTVRYGSPTEQILRVSKDYDLLILAAHRKSLLVDIVLGTTAERVIRRSRVPVLTVPSLKTAFNWARWLSEFTAAKLSAPIF